MKALESFKGVGPKTASCVLLFCLSRDSFAVDTHVFRLSKQLGWVPGKATRCVFLLSFASSVKRLAVGCGSEL
jgi:endonuclease III